MLTAQETKNIVIDSKENFEKLIIEEANQFLEHHIMPNIEISANCGYSNYVVHVDKSILVGYIIKKLEEAGYKVVNQRKILYISWK